VKPRPPRRLSQWVHARLCLHIMSRCDIICKQSRACAHWLSKLWTKKHSKVFFDVQSTNLTNCDKICYVLSWVNSSYSNVNVLRLIWIVSLPYLVKLSIRGLQVNSTHNCEPKNTPKCFCHIFYQTRPILVKFGTCFLD